MSVSCPPRQHAPHPHRIALFAYSILWQSFAARESGIRLIVRFQPFGATGRSLQPAGIPVEYIAREACDIDVGVAYGYPVARTFHGPNDFARRQIDAHDSAGQRVISNVLDVVAV